MGYLSIAIVLWSLSSNIDQGGHAYYSKQELAVKFGPWYHTGHLHSFAMTSAEADYHADQVAYKIAAYRQMCSDADQEPNDLALDVMWNAQQVFKHLSLAKDKSRPLELRLWSMHLLRLNLEYYTAWGYDDMFWTGTLPGY